MVGKRIELIIFTVFLLFSTFLMWKTLTITASGNISVAAKAWSDFAATIPLIRSFSFGANFPPEYPIFSGLPIRYHFVFFALVGLLEKFGVHLVWGLNILSSLTFFALLSSIYLLGKTIFKSKVVGLLSVILFLFNGSLAFIEFFKKNPLGKGTISAILESTDFASFGPYDGNIVSAFWSLNIFTNQRHLAFAYAVFLALILVIFKFAQKPKKLTLAASLLIGIFIGLFPFIHLAVFGMMGLSLITFFVIYPKLRKHLIITGATAFILSLPQIIYMGASQADISLINPGYLVENLTTLNFIKYWALNLGLLVILFPLGFIFANKKQRKIALPFIILFVTGNLFQLSVEMSANHKFFNLFVIGANLFISFFLVYLWRKKLYAKILVSVLFILLTLSGIIDIFPILNDGSIELKDYPNDSRVAFILENTPQDAVFLNSGFLYHPASIAGRKIFLGWPYFSWSAGYDTDKRGKLFHQIYSVSEKPVFCTLLKDNNLDYFTVEETINDPNLPFIDVDFYLKNFESAYRDDINNYYIFSRKTNCT